MKRLAVLYSITKERELIAGVRRDRLRRGFDVKNWATLRLMIDPDPECW